MKMPVISSHFAILHYKYILKWSRGLESKRSMMAINDYNYP